MLRQANVKALTYRPDVENVARVLSYLHGHPGQFYTWREIAYYEKTDFTTTCRTVEWLIATYHAEGWTVVVDPQFNHVAHQWSVLVGFRTMPADIAQMQAEEKAFEEIAYGNDTGSDGRESGELEDSTPAVTATPEPAPRAPRRKSPGIRKPAKDLVAVPAEA